jgi:hypothetical protein
MAAAVRREQMELQRFGTVMALAFNDPKELDKLFVSQAPATESVDFEDWTWESAES